MKMKTTEFVKIHETAKNDATLQAIKRRITVFKELEETKKYEITLRYYSNFSNSEEEFQFNISDIDYCATTGNQSTMIITNQQIRKCVLINTAKNDLISALELYYYKFIDSFSNINLNYIISFVTQLDILQSKCYLAKEFN